MSTPLRGALRADAAVTRVPGAELFFYEARKDGRPVARLRGVTAEGGGVTVEAEVFPSGKPAGSSGVTRPFVFASADAAERFADETLIALEYLNCEIVS